MTQPSQADHRRRPSVSDIALAMATRQKNERNFGGTITDKNAKGNVQVEVVWNSPDPEDAAIASDLYDVLRAKYPRENGAS